MTVGEPLSQAHELVQLLDFVVDFSLILWYNVLVKLEQERKMSTMKEKILKVLTDFAQDCFDETAIKVDPDTRHTLVDPVMYMHDEIDLDELAGLLADAITVKVD